MMISSGLKSITGCDPVTYERPDGSAMIAFRESDLPQVRSAIEKAILKAGKAKTDVSIALKPILVPLTLKYALPVILVLILLGGFTGYMLGRGR